MGMRIISVHVGKPQTFGTDDGEKFETAIYKTSTDEKLWARGHALEGDEPADKEDHGGEFKAVYSYAAEHYVFWKKDLGREELPYGMFGENLTTEGFDEDAVWLGDRFRIGEALLEASQPRIPCETLGFRFQDQGIVKKFLQARRMGIYFKIVEEGRLGKGDGIRREKQRKDTVLLTELTAVFTSGKADKPRLRELLELSELTPDFRKYFKQRLG